MSLESTVQSSSMVKIQVSSEDPVIMEMQTNKTTPATPDQTTPATPDQTSPRGSTSSMRFCRICHDDDEPLMAACKCKGSVAFTHERCLIEWLLRCGKPRCELCGADYLLRVRDTHGWSRMLTHRLSRHDKAMIMVNFVCVLFLISTTAWLVWSGLSPENANQRMNELFQTCYALYGFMDVFCLGIIIHEIPHMQLLWKRLKLLRYELYILPHPTTIVATTSFCGDATGRNGEVDVASTATGRTGSGSIFSRCATVDVGNGSLTEDVDQTEEDLRSTSLPHACDSADEEPAHGGAQEPIKHVTTC